MAAVEDAPSTSGGVTVGFDLFDSQTGGSWSSGVTISHLPKVKRVTSYTVRLPEMDMSTRDPVATMNQLGHFLQDVPLPREDDTATIYNGEVQFFHADDKGQDGKPKWWSFWATPVAWFTGFIEALVDGFVGGSTADTLDQYPETL